MDEPRTESVKEENSATPPSTFSTMPVVRQLAIIGLLLVGIFGLGGSALWLGNENNPEQSASIYDLKEDIKNQSDDDRLNFDELEILARTAIVVDVNSGEVLFEKSPDDKWPLASITKLMTALVASEIVKEGEVVTITASAVGQSGDGGVVAGERFSYKTLSDLVLLTSSNDGAYALSAFAGASLDAVAPETAFVKAMNVRAKELGLANTYFRNPTGLDLTEEEAGAYGTARDVATLLEYLLLNKPELLEVTTNLGTVVYNEQGSSHSADNTNYIVDAIPNAIASKTGYTTLAGGNLAVAFDAGLNRPVIAVVLGSTHQGRFSDVMQLVEASKTALIMKE